MHEKIRKDNSHYTKKLIKDTLRDNCNIKVLEAKKLKGQTKNTKIKVREKLDLLRRNGNKQSYRRFLH